MTNLDSIIKKQRHYFANKGPYSQSYGFPVVMYGRERWTIKEAECQRTDAFEINPLGFNQRIFIGRTWDDDSVLGRLKDLLTL